MNRAEKGCELDWLAPPDANRLRTARLCAPHCRDMGPRTGIGRHWCSTPEGTILPLLVRAGTLLLAPGSDTQKVSPGVRRCARRRVGPLEDWQVGAALAVGRG